MPSPIPPTSASVHPESPSLLATRVGVAAETRCTPAVKLVLEQLDLTESVRFSDAYARWLRLVGHDSTATIEQHPDCVLRELPDCPVDASGLPPVALFANPSDSPREALAAAILLPRELSLNSLGGLGFPCRLRGYRLVGDSFLGWRAYDCQRFMMSSVLDWVRQNHADFLLVENLDQRSPLRDLLDKAAEFGLARFPTARPRSVPRIRFPVPAVDLWRKFSPKALNSLRQKAKSVGRSRLIRISELDQVPGFLEHVQTIVHSALPAGHRRKTAVSGRRELQINLLLAEQHWLRSYVWIVDGTPAGFVMGYQNRSGFHLRRLACDQRFEWHSGEAIMLFRVLEDLIKHDTPSAVDLGRDDVPFTRLFANETVRTSDLLLVRGSRWLRAATAYLRFCRSVRGVVRTVVAALRDCDPLRLLKADAGSGTNSDPD